jgi:single-stranded-DNA-specific exonuclease
MNKKIKRRTPVSTSILNEDSFLLPLRRIFANRGIKEKAELSYPLSQLHPWHLMYGIDLAAKRIAEAILNNENILIIGDYDADGATSTAVAIQTLTAFGCKKVDYFIPDRFKYGYGLSPTIIDAVLPKQPKLIITVDNGISSIEGVNRANENQIDVIITDHHLAPDLLPAAYVIVNPNHPESTFPSKHLAGVGVIFYVMLALRDHLKSIHWFTQRKIKWPNMAQYLDLVALGTVADLVPLDYNNRLLVHHGLVRIRANKTLPGIQWLLQLAKRPIKNTVSADLAFAVAPRLNAAGRLDDMSIGVECLLAKDLSNTKPFAEQLDTLNNERRELENKMQQEAYQIVTQMHLSDVLPLGLCLYDAQWHSGIIGLIASKIKDKTHRPVIIFSKDEGGFLKGSARSISNLHIRDLLGDITLQYPKLIYKFGGHSMAAGLTIYEKDLKLFQKVFNDYVMLALKEIGLEDFIETDGELQPAEFTLELASAIRYASVWGKGFEEPLFDGKFKIINQYIVGQKHLKLILQPPETDRCFHGIHFYADLKKWPNYQHQFAHIVYRLNVNEYMERQQLQLIVEYIKPISTIIK